jgi:hypothetical protein
VVGGGEMNRDTSSVVSCAQSEAASSALSSRSVHSGVIIVCSAVRQSCGCAGPNVGSGGLAAERGAGSTSPR